MYRYPVRGTETDWADRLQMGALFSLMQESAVSNAEENGWGTPVLDPLRICWVLLRVSVRLDVFPRWQDVLQVETWPRELDRLFFLRDFRFRLETEGGSTDIGGATSSWILVDTGTRRPRRPGVIPYDLSRTEPGRLSIGFTAPVLPAVEGLCDGEPAIVKYADACDIDRNLHVNNTRYVAWCVDAVHRIDSGRPVLSGIDINYLAEARFGDKVRIHARREGTPTGARYPVEGREAGTDTPVFRAILYDESAAGRHSL